MDRHLPEQRIETPQQVSSDSWPGTLWWAAQNITTPDAFFALPDNRTTSMMQLMKQWKDFNALHKLLLSIGGNETCFPSMEEDMQSILTRGRFYPGKSRMMVGRPSQCHANSCELWQNNRKQFQVNIATGYALSSDGLWRQHSWLIHRYQTRTQSRMRLIETTVKRLAYFGYELTEEEAFDFCHCNGII